jgi:hypothetical protein
MNMIMTVLTMDTVQRGTLQPDARFEKPPFRIRDSKPGETTLRDSSPTVT